MVMAEDLEAIPLSEVYARFEAHAKRMQDQLDQNALKRSTTATDRFVFPQPTLGQFEVMWGRILADSQLRIYWSQRLGLVADPSRCRADQSHQTGRKDGIQKKAA